jgi:thiamine biosynthesis protein ThiI
VRNTVTTSLKGEVVRGVLLLSGGIDSPVAGYLLGRQGVELVAVHFDPSFSGGPSETEKVLKLMERLESAIGARMTKVVMEHGDTLNQLATKCASNLTCVLCRRIMLKVASRLAEGMDASFIVTGESLGQVASQTLMNIFVEEEAASVPVLRPLIGMDKIDIERVAKEIGTYDISVSTGSCCEYAPDRPSTHSSLAAVMDEETKVDIEGIADAAVRRARPIQ